MDYFAPMKTLLPFEKNTPIKVHHTLMHHTIMLQAFKFLSGKGGVFYPFLANKTCKINYYDVTCVWRHTYYGWLHDFYLSHLRPAYELPPWKRSLLRQGLICHPKAWSVLCNFVHASVSAGHGRCWRERVTGTMYLFFWCNIMFFFHFVLWVLRQLTGTFIYLFFWCNLMYFFH